MKYIIVLSLFLIGINSYSQSINGTSGLIHIPSARIIDDGQIVIGGAFIPKPYFNRNNSIGINNGLTSYLTYSILPFVEIMFRYTHELNRKVSPLTKYFPDRMFAFRLNLLKESSVLPAITFGLHDFSRIFGTENTSYNSTYSANYIVGSKYLSLNDFKLDFSLGTSFSIGKLHSRDLKGFFYGFEVKNNQFDYISILFENDTKGFNTGIKISPVDNIIFMFGFWDMKKQTFSFNYRF